MYDLLTTKFISWTIIAVNYILEVYNHEPTTGTIIKLKLLFQ